MSRIQCSVIKRDIYICIDQTSESHTVFALFYYFFAPLIQAIALCSIVHSSTCSNSNNNTCIKHVLYYFFNSTAVRDRDYEPLMENSRTYLPTCSMTVQICIPIYSDNLLEANETFIVFLRHQNGSNSTDQIRLEPDNTTVTIIDNSSKF